MVTPPTGVVRVVHPGHLTSHCCLGFSQQFRILETAPHAGRVQPITNRTNRLTLFVTYPYIRHYSCSRHWGTGARGLTGGIRSTRCPTPPEDSGEIRSGRWHQNKRTRGRCYRRRRRKHLEHVPWVCHSLNGRAVPRAAVPPHIRGAGCHGLSHLGIHLMSSLGFIMSSVRTNVQWPGSYRNWGRVQVSFMHTSNSISRISVHLDFRLANLEGLLETMIHRQFLIN